MQLEFAALLRRACSHLGLDTEQAEQVVETGCLRLADVVFVLNLNPDTSHIEILGDGGQPAPHQELELQRHLLAQVLQEELHGLALGVHPNSGHVVARAVLFFPAIDEDGWLLVGMLLTALERILELHEKFTLLPQGHT